MICGAVTLIYMIIFDIFLSQAIYLPKPQKIYLLIHVTGESGSKRSLQKSMWYMYKYDLVWPLPSRDKMVVIW